MGLFLDHNRQDLLTLIEEMTKEELLQMVTLYMFVVAAPENGNGKAPMTRVEMSRYVDDFIKKCPKCC